MPFVPITRLSRSPGCSQIVLHQLCNRQSFYSRNSKKKLLNLFAAKINSYKMNYGTERVLTLENMNPAVIKLEYAVRGPLVIRASEIQKELLENVSKYRYYCTFKTFVILFS